MATLTGIRGFYLLRILLPFLISIPLAQAETIRMTKVEGQKIRVTCPTLTEGELLATSFIKRINNDYITLFTRRAQQPFQRPTEHNEDVSLDSGSLVMTVNKLKIGDNGATYSCKVFSSKREVHNSVIVKVIVTPKISFSMTPKGPYEPNTAVTIACTVDRVSPRPTSLAVRVAGRVYREPTITTNADGTFRYALVRRHVVTKGDDGKDADCRVNSQDRKQYRKRERMLLVRPPSGKPSIVTSRTVLHPGDLLRLTCNLQNKGVPPANKYVWYKNGKFVKNSGASNVWNIRVTNEAASGSFSCKGTNKKGSSEVSVPQCVAFTKQTPKASGLPLWISIVSILLNIAALVFIIIVHVKPRVVRYLAEREEKKLKKLNKSPITLNENKKEENVIEKEGSKTGQPSGSEKPVMLPVDPVHFYDVPPVDNHTYDNQQIPTEKGTVGDKEEEKEEKAAYEDMRL